MVSYGEAGITNHLKMHVYLIFFFTILFHSMVIIHRLYMTSLTTKYYTSSHDKYLHCSYFPTVVQLAPLQA